MCFRSQEGCAFFLWPFLSHLYSKNYYLGQTLRILNTEHYFAFFSDGADKFIFCDGWHGTAQEPVLTDSFKQKLWMLHMSRYLLKSVFVMLSMNLNDNHLKYSLKCHCFFFFFFFSFFRPG